MYSLENLYEYFLTKPPEVIFFISIILFTISLAGISVTIENEKEHLINPDIKSWNSLFSSVSKLGICALPNINDVMEPSKERNLNRTKISFKTAASLDDLSAKKILKVNYINGIINIKDLVNNGHEIPNDIIKINVKWMKKNKLKGEACVSIEGPVAYLPNAVVPTPHCDFSMEKPSNVLFMENWKAEDEFYCKSLKHGHLNLPTKDSLNVYLNQDDVSLIQMHILETTLLLVIVILLILICAPFNSSIKIRQVECTSINIRYLVPVFRTKVKRLSDHFAVKQL